MDISNEALAPVVASLIEIAPEFEARSRGRDLGAIFTTLAHVFPEDKHAIVAGLGELQASVQGKAVSRPKVASGGSRDATPKIKTTKVRTSWAPDDENCDDCPPKGPVGTHRNDTTHLHTKAGVLEAFQDDAEVLTMHARQLGVDIGNATKADTIANKIAKHYRDGAEKPAA